MKNRYRLVCLGHRGGMYYAFDTKLNKRESLATKDVAEAEQLILVKNDADRHTAMSLQMAQVYLQRSDPSLFTRVWREVVETIISLKEGRYRQWWEDALTHKALASLWKKRVLETTAEDLLKLLREGTVSTNAYLRRLHHFALSMHWVLQPVLPKAHWPKLVHKERRAITAEEHQRIVAREKNRELRAFYQTLWHLGGSQSDMAQLTADNIDWVGRMVSYRRNKTKVPVDISFGDEVAALFRSLPSSGLLFPRLARMKSKHRATRFARRLLTLGISGISLHSYRYAWAERAKTVGMPERFAQQALGHSSTACARAYSRNAAVKIPSLEEYEQKIITLPKAVNA